MFEIDDICTKFGLEKCVKATFLPGILEKSTSIELDNRMKIKEQEEVYKYLGVNERNGIQHATMKEKSIKECYRRVRAFTKKELNSANRTQSINTLAITVVTYSSTSSTGICQASRKWARKFLNY